MAESNFAVGFFLTGAGEGTSTCASGVRNGDAMVGFLAGGLGCGDGELGVGVDEVEAELGAV